MLSFQARSVDASALLWGIFYLSGDLHRSLYMMMLDMNAISNETTLTRPLGCFTSGSD